MCFQLETAVNHQGRTQVFPSDSLKKGLPYASIMRRDISEPLVDLAPELRLEIGSFFTLKDMVGFWGTKKTFWKEADQGMLTQRRDLFGLALRSHENDPQTLPNTWKNAFLKEASSLLSLRLQNDQHTSGVRNRSLHTLSLFCPSLQKLSLDLPLRDEHLQEVASFRNLQTLHLGKNPLISEKGISQLQNLSLTTLSLSQATISLEMIQHLARLPLRSLSLKMCHLHPLVTQCLQRFSSLEKLDLSHTNVTDFSLSHLGRIATLKFLNVSFCTLLTDTGVLQILSLPLIYLDMSSCRNISGNAISTLQTLPIKTLKIKNCDINDNDLQNLKNNKQLERLVVVEECFPKCYKKERNV